MSENKHIPVSTIFVFVAMSFATAMSGTIFNAILDKVALEMNISISRTGMLSSFYAYGAGLGTPVFLILFRNRERTFMMKLMLLCTILSSLLFLVVSAFSFLLLARFLMGMFANCYCVLATAIIVAMSSPDRVGKNVSVLFAGSAVALMAGLPLTRVLSENCTWREEYSILISVMAVSLLYFQVKLPCVGKDDRSPELKSEAVFLKDRKTLLHLIICLIFYAGYGAFYMYLTPYIVELFQLSEGRLSIILMIIGLCCFSGNLTGGIVCDSIGYAKALTLGSISILVSSVLIYIASGSASVTVVLIFIWMYLAWFIGLQINTGIAVITDNRSSLVLSLNTSGMQLGQAVGTSVAGAVIARSGLPYIALCPVAATLVVLLLISISEKRTDV